MAQLPKLRDKGWPRSRRQRRVSWPSTIATPIRPFFAETSHDEIDALGEEPAALGPKLDTLMAEWEGIEGELAEAESKSDSE